MRRQSQFFDLLALLVVILFLLAAGCSSPSSPASTSTPLLIPSSDPAAEGERLPAVVIDAVAAALPGAAIVAANRQQEEGETLYEVLVETADGTFEVDVDPDGTVVEIEEAAQDERPVRPEDLPAAVRDAVAQTVPGGRITEAVRETVRGAVRYDVEVDVRGRKFDLKVAPDGTVLEVEEGN